MLRDIKGVFPAAEKKMTEGLFFYCQKSKLGLKDVPKHNLYSK